MIPEIVLTVMEILGTIAFAVSGAFVAINAKFDVFGVLVIGCLTAVGGGITRDILIGATPPTIFSKLYIVAIAAMASLIVFIVAYIYRRQFRAVRERVETVNNVFDALGLAAFTVTGTAGAFSHTEIAVNPFLSITLGVLTGVGGGVLRDVLTETPPYIFKKHVYALASIFGASIYYALRWWIGEAIIPSAVAMAFIFVIRILATKYRWSLPKISLQNEKKRK